MTKSTLAFLLTTLLSVEAFIAPHPQPTATTRLNDLVVTLDGNPIRGDITPLGNMCLVRVKDTLQATAGGVLLPDESKERPSEGLVMEAGPGRIHPVTAKLIHNPVSPGVSVLYGKLDGKAIEYKGDECQMIRDEDIMLYYTGVSMNMENVIPCRDFVLVKVPQKEEQMTSSGVVIADMVTKEDETCEGEVISVGEGRLNSSGELSPSPVALGDMIKFKDYAGNDVRIEGKDYVLVRMVEILATSLKDAKGDDEAEP